jgi:hypothetical protein
MGDAILICVFLKIDFASPQMANLRALSWHGVKSGKFWKTLKSMFYSLVQEDKIFSFSQSVFWDLADKRISFRTF